MLFIFSNEKKFFQWKRRPGKSVFDYTFRTSNTRQDTSERIGGACRYREHLVQKPVFESFPKFSENFCFVNVYDTGS
ncbi:hypothetical protein CEXT_793681, partial [Caerostris extrusa]